jgi:uncharacterized RDD family membrane protein YckC
MPFCGELTAHFQFFKRCGDLANISVSRVDRDEISSNISESIYRSIRDADLILVDLTGSNPNVLYELGVAHSMGKRVILVADSVDSVPFDIANYRIKTIDFESSASVDEVAASMTEAVSETFITGPLSGEVVYGENLAGKRALSFLIDQIPVLLSIALGILKFGFTEEVLEETNTYFVVAIYIVIAYLVLSTWYWGSTFGQRLFGLRVVSFSGERLSLSKSTLRILATYFVSGMTLGIGFVGAMIGPSYRALHDNVTKSIVIRRE